MTSHPAYHTYFTIPTGYHIGLTSTSSLPSPQQSPRSHWHGPTSQPRGFAASLFHAAIRPVPSPSPHAMPSSTTSAIYLGHTRHRRRLPATNTFTYALFMLCVDLHELESGALDRWPLFSSRTPAAFLALLPRDHLGGDDGALRARVLSAVAARTGRQPRGAVLLLTCPRVLGLEFNPVSFYYVMGERGEVDVLVAEVNNIPWFEQHLYVLEPERSGASAAGAEGGAPMANAEAGALQMRRFKGHEKAFHVSPFMPLAGVSYDWLVSPPGERLAVRIGLSEGGESFFSASIDMRRRAWSLGGLLWVLLRYPLIALYVVAGIMLEAGKLWGRGFVFYPHPDGAETASSKAIGSALGFVVSFKVRIQGFCGSSGTRKDDSGVGTGRSVAQGVGPKAKKS